MNEKNIQLGLKENWKQFTLLLIVNAFVGGMVGLERTILPVAAAPSSQQRHGLFLSNFPILSSFSQLRPFVSHHAVDLNT